jgi:hypothetical protein
VTRRDWIKSCLSVVFFGLAFGLPLVALAVGWLGWDFEHGAIASAITFAVLFLIGGVLLITIRAPAWVVVFLPTLLGLFYSAIPEFIPGGVDDMAVMIMGVFLTYILWLKKRPNTARWIILPLLVSGVYPFFGSFIPGPFDEMIVSAIAFGIAWIYGYRPRYPRLP